MPLRGDALNLPPNWLNFLQEVDEHCPGRLTLHCLGGFVLVVAYGAPRLTGDLDYVAVIPQDEENFLEAFAGVDSDLARKHKFYLQRVGVADLPEDYDSRLTEILEGRFRHLRLWALDPYDLALSKLTRNSRKDREDVVFLITKLKLDPAILRERYQKELRPYLANEARHDLTLELWIEQAEETGGQPGSLVP